ncbi:hypothetical protein T484DRAFT_1750138 [Baffinella frigidus]|nr:hypothetical protein T484DRAFT_1750138 [Cryptophyta sp. CCMP2293]
MDGARHAKRRAGALLVAIVLAAAAGSALGALDSVKGPREHPVEGQITQLQRQLFEAVLEGDSNLLSITNLITAGEAFRLHSRLAWTRDPEPCGPDTRPCALPRNHKT